MSGENSGEGNNIRPQKIQARVTRTASVLNDTTFYELDQTGKPTVKQIEKSRSEEDLNSSTLLERLDLHKQVDEQQNKIRSLELEIQNEQTENIRLLAKSHTDERDLTQLNYQNQILRRNLNRRKMAVTLTDAILAIPVFKGEKKELETFLNTCDVYMDIIPNEHKDNLLRIIKTKIVGDALAKIAPIEDLANWQAIKAKLKLKVYKKVSFEFAQEDLNNITQYKDETIEKYGNRIKEKLRNLNEAISDITTENAEKIILRKVNEKQAISKFQQNLRDNNIRILVSASSKENLDEAITYALQKELLEKHKKTASCGLCGLTNHSEENCRKKKNTNNFTANKYKRNDQKPEYKKYQNNDQKESTNNTQKEQTNYKNYNQNSDQKPSTSKQYENKNYFNKNNNGNKNVKTLNQEGQGYNRFRRRGRRRRGISNKQFSFI